MVALPRECTTCRRLVHFIAVNFALHDCQLHKGAIRGLEKAGGCGALTGCWAGSVCVLPESLPQPGRWAPSRGEGLAQRCSTKRRGHTARKPQTVPGLRPDLRSPADLQGSLWAEPSWGERGWVGQGSPVPVPGGWGGRGSLAAHPPATGNLRVLLERAGAAGLWVLSLGMTHAEAYAGSRAPGLVAVLCPSSPAPTLATEVGTFQHSPGGRLTVNQHSSL